MAANTYLSVTNLDFDEIRENLKTHLKLDDSFQDYNFEGSVMANILDVLAYNTHYNAYYINMLANEMFLDTAQQRDSVVSRAKELGYVPVSAIGSSANIHINFSGVTSEVKSFELGKYSKFTTTVDDVRYTYVTPESYTVTRTEIGNVSNYSRSIEIKEGEPLTHKWEHDGANPTRFIIPNSNVDTSSITVKVQASTSDTTTVDFIRANNINQIYSTSPIFFLEEASDGKYEIVFALGALGKSLLTGNVVIVEYLVCNDSITNGASSFTSSDLSVSVPYTSMDITVNHSAKGGRPKETIESIKFNAPKSYQTQNRAIIDNDYQRIILNENADLQSAVAYGGEQAVPPVYGKVYIAVKPYGEEYTTINRKLQIKESILTRTPLGIDPVIVDPDYLYIIPTITTYFNKTTSYATEASIEALVSDTIDEFSASKLERFGNRLRYSRFVRHLDNITTGSILNNDASIKIQKRITPNVNDGEKIYLNFANPIRKGTVTSTEFTYDGHQAKFDDVDGVINIFRYDSEYTKIYILEAGTIDYDKGVISVENFSPSAYLGIQLHITASPDKVDIIPVRDQILLMNSSDAAITAVPEYN